MRILTNSEVRYVAGGFGASGDESTPVDDIDVTGKRGMSRDDISQFIDSYGSGGVVGGTGGLGGGGSGQYNPIYPLFDKLLEKLIFGPSEREDKIAEEFGEHTTVQNVQSSSGDRGWRMDNGDIYWDTNNNNKADLITRVDPLGNRF